MMTSPRWITVFGCWILLGLTGCATSQISEGQLSEGVYYSGTDAFSITLPEETTVYDGPYPLGGYVALDNLADADPIIRQGVIYNRVALPEGGEISRKDERNLIKGSVESWLYFFTDLTEEDILHEEWFESEGRPVHFSVIEGPDGGALVKPASYYGSYSILIDNYSYTLFERVAAPYQLKGSDDSPERLERLNPEVRKASILKFAERFRFNRSEEREFPLAE